MKDNPLFNAGKGAIVNVAGKVRLLNMTNLKHVKLFLEE